MFGALNRFISRLDSEPLPRDDGVQGAFGFQILRNTNNDLPIEPWFDFIIGINGRNIDSPDLNLFVTEVRNCAGSSVNFGIWSAKGQRVRSIYAEVPPDASIGLSAQWTSLSSTEDVWHILDVIPNSPADIAGLLPYGDYIIGSPEGLLKGEAGLGELVEDYIDRPLRLYIYNHEYNVTRLLTITPTRNWGGTGALGCVLGFGALHRIPAPLDEPPPAPGETVFEITRLSTDELGGPPSSYGFPADPTPLPTSTPQVLIPADMQFDPATLPPPPSSHLNKPLSPAGGPRRSRPQHYHSSNATDMDAYFAEGEANSREQDLGANTKYAPTPPPRKYGAPPRAVKTEAEPTEAGSAKDEPTGEEIQQAIEKD